MHIMILTVGSRGDVQPYLALGVGLRAAGHTVTLAAPSGYETQTARHGLRYAPLSADFLEIMQTPEGKAALSGSMRARMALMSQVMSTIRTILDESWAAAQGVEAIVYHPKAMGGYSIAEALGIPGFLSIPLPAYSPTGAFPNPLFGITRDLGGWLNRLTYQVIPMLSVPYRKVLNGWRREALGLGPQSLFAGETEREGQPVPRLYPYSPLLVPAPPEWDGATHVTGAWFLNEGQGWEPPAALQRFLEAGPPPVYVGFGSMVGQDSAALTRMVRQALEATGQRGLLATGWGGLGETGAGDNIFLLDQAPHDWLFPRMAAVVHHGGAGTTAAGLLAGKPTVICPFFGDQPFWGARVAALGAGPAPLPQKSMTAASLTEAIRAATSDSAMQAKAAEIGAKMRQEDGVGRTIEIIEATVAAWATRRPAPGAAARAAAAG